VVVKKKVLEEILKELEELKRLVMEKGSSRLTKSELSALSARS